MRTPKLLKIVSMIPLKNQVELVDLENGLTVYWNLGTALNTRMYQIGDVYLVSGTVIEKIETLGAI